MFSAQSFTQAPYFTRKLSAVCWQGWCLRVPRRWHPTRLEGNFFAGYALFADALRPRIGLRWTSPGRRGFTGSALQSALAAEVGQQAAGEAIALPLNDARWESCLLYTEPKPPGRDVWIGISRVTGRMLQVVYHARRGHILASRLLPSLVDRSPDRAIPWAIFDLSCVVPGEMPLVRQSLHAGDLSLTFAGCGEQVTVRQVAVAQLALQRVPLAGWTATPQGLSNHYRMASTPSEVTLTVAGFSRRVMHSVRHRRRRFFYLRSQPRELYTHVVHDEERDRLVIVEGSEEGMVREVLKTVGTTAVDAF